MNKPTKSPNNTARVSVLVLIFLLLVAQLSFATTSRISSLGSGGDYFEDDSNVRRWFGSLVDYPNQVTMESGHFNSSDGYRHELGWKRSGPGFSSHLNLGQDGRWGTAALFFRLQDETSSSAIYQLHLKNNLGLQYGVDVGLFSAGISYVHSDATAQKSGSPFELPYHSFGAGLRLDLGPRAYLDFAGDIQFFDEDQLGNDGTQGHESNSCYSFRGRAFVGLGPRMAVVPLMEVIHEELQHSASADRFHFFKQQRFGLGLNYFPDTDHLLLLSAEYTDGSRAVFDPSLTLTDDWSAFILKAGFETRVLSWLTTRGSVGYVNYDLVTDSWGGTLASYSAEPEDPVMRINLGASFHLGPADLDLSFAERFPEARFLTGDLIQNKHWFSITGRYLF